MEYRIDRPIRTAGTAPDAVRAHRVRGESASSRAASHAPIRSGSPSPIVSGFIGVSSVEPHHAARTRNETLPEVRDFCMEVRAHQVPLLRTKFHFDAPTLSTPNWAVCRQVE